MTGKSQFLNWHTVPLSLAATSWLFPWRFKFALSWTADLVVDSKSGGATVSQAFQDNQLLKS